MTAPLASIAFQLAALVGLASLIVTIWPARRRILNALRRRD